VAREHPRKQRREFWRPTGFVRWSKAPSRMAPIVFSRGLLFLRLMQQQAVDLSPLADVNPASGPGNHRWLKARCSFCIVRRSVTSTGVSSRFWHHLMFGYGHFKLIRW
jgi:hypothetical protein